MILYHFTCVDGAHGIRRDRRILTHDQSPIGLPPLVWLTDLDVPDRAALGLTSRLLSCDRTEWRVTVDVDAVPWHRFARRLPLGVRRPLEMAPGALPMHWWVVDVDVPVAVEGIRRSRL